MPLVGTIFVVLALICFLLGAVQLQPPNITARLNWVSLGLACLTIVYLMLRS
jgi:hypothetical protein